MATTEGLTLATTSAILGNTGALLSIRGGVQLESILSTALLVGDELGGGEVSVLDCAQPLLSERAKISIADITRYFIFTFFIVNFIIAGGKAKAIAWGGIIAIFFQKLSQNTYKYLAE